jgi:thioredoxin reductase
MGSFHQIKNIAIIGAGPTGLAAAKYGYLAMLRKSKLIMLDISYLRNHSRE